MSALGKPKFTHPNKLVVQHENFLTNKSLVAKMRAVKSSIPQPDKEFDRKIENRKKRSFRITNSQNSGSVLDEKTMKAIIVKRIKLLTAPASHEERTNAPIRQIYDETDELFGKDYNPYFMNQNRMPRAISTSEIKSKICESLLNKMSSPKNPVKLQAITKLLPSSSNHVALLQNQLEAKELEVKAIKEELKGWWHEDLKPNAINNPNSNSKGATTNRYCKQNCVTDKENREPQSFSHLRQNENQCPKPSKRNDSFRTRLLPSFLPKNMLKSDLNTQKEDPSQRDVKKFNHEKALDVDDSIQRPVTVKLPARIGISQFKIRGSSHFGGISNKISTRYIETPKSKPKNELLDPENCSNILGDENNFSTQSEERGEEENTNDILQEESPRLEIISKTLLHQLPATNFTHSLNKSGMKLVHEYSDNLNTDEEKHYEDEHDYKKEENSDELGLSMINPMDGL